jgi:hypothetical protein
MNNMPAASLPTAKPASAFQQFMPGADVVIDQSKEYAAGQDR